MSSNGAWTTSEHCEKYCQHVKTQQSLLQKVWDDLQIPSEEQTQQLLDTAHEAEEVWKDALRVAERQRDTVREQIDQAQRQTAKLQAELSDEVFPEEEVAQAGPRSLKAHQDLADKDLQKWLRRKAVRQQKYEALKEKCECLREQMGLVGSSVPVKTITLYVLDGLSMELQQLQAERAERQQRLDLHFKELRKMCMVLGEDEGVLAAAIHPTLGTSRDAQSSSQDLSERTVDGLRHKTLELQQLERSRAEQGETLMNTLHSLWDALDVPVDDVDRELFGRLMHGPSRLYQSSLDKCMQEVARLEGARKDLMLGIIDSKRQQLAAVCALTHMSMPPLPEAHPAESGEVADVLSRVMKQLQVAATEAEGRQEVLAAIQALDAAVAEAEWLSGYEDDPNKYKGRDSTRKIQRAISASEQRKQLPLLISQVEAALESFRTHHGRAFLYDGMEYQGQVLAPLKAQVQEQEDKKAQGTKAHQKGLLASAKKGARAPPGTPKRASRAGERSSQDGGIRKPAVASATPFSERRRAEGALSRTASTLSRTESNASRSDFEVTGSNNLADRVSRLLQSAAASPAVSRTASGMSDADRERQVVHTPDIKKIKAIQEDVYTEMEKPGGPGREQD